METFTLTYKNAGVKVVNATNSCIYAGNKQRNDTNDGILEKHWNRKALIASRKGGKAPNATYAEKYGSTLDRLKRKIEARKNNN